MVDDVWTQLAAKFNKDSVASWFGRVSGQEGDTVLFRVCFGRLHHKDYRLALNSSLALPSWSVTTSCGQANSFGHIAQDSGFVEKKRSVNFAQCLSLTTNARAAHE